MCFRPAAPAAGPIKCPECGKEVATPNPDNTCPFCGADLGAGVPAPGAPGAPGAPKAPGAPGAPKAPGAPGAPKAPGA